MRRPTLILLALAALALAYPAADSFTLRPLNTDSCGTSGCHGAPASAVNITIAGPDTLLTNAVAEYTVVVAGGPSRRFGFYAVAVDGENRSVDLISGLPLFDVHPRFDVTGNSGEFRFNVTAPRYPTLLTIRVAAVSANGDGGPSGDSWNTEEKLVRVANPPLAPNPSAAAFALEVALAVSVSFVLYRAAERRWGP